MSKELEQAKANLAALLVEYSAKEQKILDHLTKEQRIEIGRPIKEVSQLDNFMANGNKYIVHTSLSINRFEEFEKLQVRVGYGVDFRQMFASMRKAFDYLNESQPADASVILYNLMHGIKNNLDGRDNEVLDLVCLFICREGEDLSKFDKELHKAKKEDFKIEGINMDSLFTFAFNLVNGFIPIYQEVSASISDHMDKVTEEIQETRKVKSNISIGGSTK